MVKVRLFESNVFLVTRKGGDQSILYFPQQVADALQEYPGGTGIVSW